MNTDNRPSFDGIYERREGILSVIRFKRHFGVSQERIWYAVSDRQGAKLWLNTIDQLELKVGGAFSIRTYDENNPAAWTTGIVTEVQPPRVLEYTWNQGPYGGGPAMQSKVRYEIESEPEGSALTITHTLYDTSGDMYVATFLGNYHMHLDALTQVMSGKYKDFSDYMARGAAESGLSDREFLIKLSIGLHDGYAKKYGRATYGKQ